MSYVFQGICDMNGGNSKKNIICFIQKRSQGKKIQRSILTTVCNLLFIYILLYAVISSNALIEFSRNITWNVSKAKPSRLQRLKLLS